MKKSPYIMILLALIVLIIISEAAPLLGLTNQPYFHENLLRQLFNTQLFPPACLGSILAYLLLLPTRKKELIITIIVGVAFELILRHYKPIFVSSLTSCKPGTGIFDQLIFTGPGLLLSCILAILGRIFQAYKLNNPKELQTNLEILSLSIAMPVLLCLDALVSNQAVYDPYLYAIDSLWGVQISFVITKLLRSNSFYSFFMEVIYYYLPLWMILAQILIYRSNTKLGLSHNKYLVPALFFIVIAIGGTISYHFIPAVGLEFYCGSNLFPNGPWPPVNMNPHPLELPPYFPRNSMPSLHFAWILAAYYSLYRFKAIYKNVALVFVVLTALSALSVGCHYIVDLIMSVPLCTVALALVIVEAPNKIRLLSGLWGIVATLSWFYLFRHHIVILLTHPLSTKFWLCLTDFVSFALLYFLCRQSYQRNFRQQPKQDHKETKA